MARCFVIQPFDKGPYDKRYQDVFVPAIKNADLEPYRVDQDPAVTIPIEDIENGIRDSDICLADITTDNPNVWYEVGFAAANGRPVVLLCAAKRPTPYPFDVHHRHIISYDLDSPSDFRHLENEITLRLKGQIRKAEAIQSVAALSPVKKTEGLSSYEVACLVAVMENLDHSDLGVTPRTVREDMSRAGYTSIAISLAIESLKRKEMIYLDSDEDHNGNQYTVLRVKQTGVDWLLEHQDKFVMKVDEQTDNTPAISDEDIPF